MSDQPDANVVLERFHSGLSLNSIEIHKALAVQAPESSSKSLSSNPLTRTLDLSGLGTQAEQTSPQSPVVRDQSQPEPFLRRLPAVSEQTQPQTQAQDKQQQQSEPNLRRLPAGTEPGTRQPDVVTPRASEVPPTPRPTEQSVVPRPHRSNLSAGQELSKLIEMPSALLTGYFFSKRAGENTAKSNASKLAYLSDHSIPKELATEFNMSREDLSARLKGRLSEASTAVDSAFKADPTLYEQGYRFQFQKAHLSEELLKKIHRPGDFEEVLTALDNVPKSGLTVEQLGQVTDYSTQLGNSPLLQQDGLSRWTTELSDSTHKFRDALAETKPNDFTEMTQSGRAANAAEREFYESLTKLRHNLGLSKHAADLELQAVMQAEPDLFVPGRRFEFDLDITPERVAELKRPEQLRELLLKVEKTHNPEAAKLITSQGEHLEALKGLSKNSVIASEGLTDVATTLESNAGKIIDCRAKAFNLMLRDQPRIFKNSMLTLGAGVGVNWAIDRLVFNDQTAGASTYAANIFGPAILLTAQKPQVKFAVIVGSHLLARISEVPQNQHLERSGGK